MATRAAGLREISAGLRIARSESVSGVILMYICRVAASEFLIAEGIRKNRRRGDES